MALMLRYLGDPGARRGRLHERPLRTRRRRWTVSDHDAHAWVEVWFPGYGWLPSTRRRSRHALGRLLDRVASFERAGAADPRRPAAASAAGSARRPAGRAFDTGGGTAAGSGVTGAAGRWRSLLASSRARDRPREARGVRRLRYLTHDPRRRRGRLPARAGGLPRRPGRRRPAERDARPRRPRCCRASSASTPRSPRAALQAPRGSARPAAAPARCSPAERALRSAPRAIRRAALDRAAASAAGLAPLAVTAREPATSSWPPARARRLRPLDGRWAEAGAARSTAGPSSRLLLRELARRRVRGASRS